MLLQEPHLKIVWERVVFGGANLSAKSSKGGGSRHRVSYCVRICENGMCETARFGLF